MKTGKIIWLILLIPIFIGIIFPGCSDKTFVSSTTSVPSNANPEVYIPLEQGLRVSYVLLEPATEYYDIEVTDPVQVAGNPGFAIRKTNRATGETEIFYRYHKDNAIFESGSTDYPGVKILESPFIAGKTWDRFDTTTSPETGTNDNYDWWFDNSDDDGTDPGNTLKTRPDGEYGWQMRIVGFETVEAMNGNSYGNCIKVAWQTGEWTVNYYWYAPGIGLVKFEEGRNLLAASTGNILGVMTDFKTVEY